MKVKNSYQRRRGCFKAWKKVTKSDWKHGWIRLQKSQKLSAKLPNVLRIPTIFLGGWGQSKGRGQTAHKHIIFLKFTILYVLFLMIADLPFLIINMLWLFSHKLFHNIHKIAIITLSSPFLLLYLYISMSFYCFYSHH